MSKLMHSPTVDLRHQSQEIPDSGGARFSCLYSIGQVLETPFDDIKTVNEILLRGQKVSGDGPCLGRRDSKAQYNWLTYGEVIRRSRRISSGLVQIGMKPGQDTFVGIYAKNCIEWVLIEQACYIQSTVPVPLYDTLGPTACTYIMNNVSAEMVICDTDKRAKSLLESDIPCLRRFIMIGEEVSKATKDIAEKKGITMHHIKNIEELGRKEPGNFKLPKPDDLAVICYTSGTTGNPKGVMLTHENIIWSIKAMMLQLGVNFFNSNDRYLSFLPMAHVFERMSQCITFLVGAKIGFSRGDVALLIEDIQALRPTLFSTVPRVLNKVFDQVQSKANSSKVKRFLLDKALKSKSVQIERGIIRNDTLWDHFVFKNVRDAFGGNIRFIICSGAPIRDEVLTFFRCSMGCPVVQAYGQTELSAGTCTFIGDGRTGVVGPPLPFLNIKLMDVTEMGYSASNGKGEICFRGPMVTKGYYKNPEKTLETIDEDGWLHTGDIGHWTENGSLAVIDRKKHIFKLSQGEYISPEKIESIYQASPIVNQCFIYGDSFQSFLIAVVVPDPVALQSLCEEGGIKGEITQLYNNKEVRKLVCLKLNQLGKKHGLRGFEQVKAVCLHPEIFSLENGLLTATMKVRRADCQRYFKEEIKAMYDSLK